MRIPVTCLGPRREGLEVFDGPVAVAGKSACKSTAIPVLRGHIVIGQGDRLLAGWQNYLREPINAPEPAGRIVDLRIFLPQGRANCFSETGLREVPLSARRVIICLLKHVDRVARNVGTRGLVGFRFEMLTPFGDAEVARQAPAYLSDKIGGTPR